MSENVTRLLSGLVYILLLIFATLYSRESFLILFGVFMLQTVKEFSRIANLPLWLAIISSSIVYLQFSVFGTSNWIELSSSLFSVIILFQLMYWLFSDNMNKPKLTNWLLLLGYIILPFVFLTRMVLLENQESGFYYPNIVIGIFIIIWTNDTFAYIVGKSIGKTKLFERISPKKTIEGFIGGMVFAIIAGIIISITFETHLSTLNWIFASIIISFFGTIGDLVESKFKRIANVKDSGNIMPGHGGILDRLDSVIFVVPILFLFFKIIQYVS